MNGIALWIALTVPPAQPEPWVPSPMPQRPPPIVKPKPICPPGGT